MCRGVAGVRWVAPEQLHLTLRFLGDADRAGLTAVADRLAEIAVPPMAITIGGAGRFPPRGPARILWAGIAPSRPLQVLAERVEGAARAAGFAAEPRPFHAHITLGRLKRPTPAGEIGAFMGANAPVLIGPVPVDRFHLYASVLAPGGPTHTIERSYPLGG